MEGLGRVFNVVPIAAGAGLSLKNASAVTFVCTGNDTFTITCASSFGGSYATPGNIITKTYTSSATNGTAAWATATQAASNAVVISSGSVAFHVPAGALPDGKDYIKVSAGGSGLVMAIFHDLTVQRHPANLAVLGV
ncbi:hypothetical protein [Streptomyces sp. 1222.5]|uniref:hypothetical protein n=1 Tax=Streptomyces sp. 1222.5 TaxID=1881026 RepID=UPI003EBD43E0